MARRGLSKQERKQLIQAVKGMELAVEEGLETLSTSGDADGALELIRSIRNQIKNLEAGPLGHAFHGRNKLAEVEERWRKAVGTVRDDIAAFGGDVEKACVGDQPALAAAGALKGRVLPPVGELFDPKAFAALIGAMTGKDAAPTPAMREAALARVREIERVIEGDDRVRMLAVQNPFDTHLRFRELQATLDDLEISLTREILD